MSALGVVQSSPPHIPLVLWFYIAACAGPPWTGGREICSQQKGVVSSSVCMLGDWFSLRRCYEGDSTTKTTPSPKLWVCFTHSCIVQKTDHQLLFSFCTGNGILWRKQGIPPAGIAAVGLWDEPGSPCLRGGGCRAVTQAQRGPLAVAAGQPGGKQSLLRNPLAKQELWQRLAVRRGLGTRWESCDSAAAPSQGLLPSRAGPQ